MSKKNLKDGNILLPVNGISLKIHSQSSVQDVLRAMEGITVVLHIGDGDTKMQLPLHQLPTEDLPEFRDYNKRLKYPI